MGTIWDVRDGAVRAINLPSMYHELGEPAPYFIKYPLGIPKIFPLSFWNVNTARVIVLEKPLPFVGIFPTCFNPYEGGDAHKVYHTGVTSRFPG